MDIGFPTARYGKSEHTAAGRFILPQAPRRAVWLAGLFHAAVAAYPRPAAHGDAKANTADDEQILDLLRRTQELERQRDILYGLVLIVLGIACGAMSKTTGGTDVQNFIAGILTGLSAAETLSGIWIVGKKLL